MPTDRIEVTSGVIQIMRDGEIIGEYDIMDSPIIDFEFERRDSITKLEEFCDLMGIGIEETFRKEPGGDLYKIAYNCYIYKWNESEDLWEEDDSGVFSWLVGGNRPIIVWTPALYDTFYFPDFMDESGVNSDIWDASVQSFHIRDRVGVFKTKDEARDKAVELGWLQ